VGRYGSDVGGGEEVKAKSKIELFPQFFDKALEKLD
jgi:hypothetical protein